MKKITAKIFSALMILLMITFTGCQKTDLYQAGLEMTVLMGEMVANDDYVSMVIGNNSDIDIDKVRARDYDTPVKVYSITSPTFEKSLEKFLQNGATFKENFEKLPESIKEQVKQQINFSAIISIVSHEMESDFDSYESVVLTNSFLAQKKKEGKIEQAIIYLYVFETGQPIIVEYTPITNKEYNIASRFFLSKECNTLSGVRTLFEPYGCEVNSVK